LPDVHLLEGDADADDLVVGNRGGVGSQSRSPTMISAVLKRFLRAGS
jgi:hypothetical protein